LTKAYAKPPLTAKYTETSPGVRKTTTTRQNYKEESRWHGGMGDGLVNHKAKKESFDRSKMREVTR